MGQHHPKGISQYKPEYEVIRSVDDPNYGQVKLVREKNSHFQMILKEFVFDTKQAFEEEVKFLKARIAFDHPNIVKLIGYNTQEAQNLCSSLYRINVFIEVLTQDLDTVLKQRMRNKEHYTENDVLFLAENLISALYYLEENRLIHGDIRPLNIFVLEDLYKLTDPKLEINRNSDALVKAIINKSHTFLSPQLLVKVPEGKFEHRENRYKADVFSLGVTLLSIATLTDSEDLYDYEKGELNEELFNERLHKIQKRYSSFTFELIRDMLNVDPEKRPNFAEIRDTILPYQEEIYNKLELPFLHTANFPTSTIRDERENQIFMMEKPVEQVKRTIFSKPFEEQEIRNEEKYGRGEQRKTDYELYSIHQNPEQHIWDSQQQKIIQHQQQPEYNFQHSQPNVIHENDQNNRESDLEARIRAALKRSRDTFHQVYTTNSGPGIYGTSKETTIKQDAPLYSSSYQTNSNNIYYPTSGQSFPSAANEPTKETNFVSQLNKPTEDERPLKSGLNDNNGVNNSYTFNRESFGNAYQPFSYTTQGITNTSDVKQKVTLDQQLDQNFKLSTTEYTTSALQPGNDYLSSYTPQAPTGGYTYSFATSDNPGYNYSATATDFIKENKTATQGITNTSDAKQVSSFGNIDASNSGAYAYRTNYDNPTTDLKGSSTGEKFVKSSPLVEEVKRNKETPDQHLDQNYKLSTTEYTTSMPQTGNDYLSSYTQQAPTGGYTYSFTTSDNPGYNYSATATDFIKDNRTASDIAKLNADLKKSIDLIKAQEPTQPKSGSTSNVYSYQTPIDVTNYNRNVGGDAQAGFNVNRDNFSYDINKGYISQGDVKSNDTYNYTSNPVYTYTYTNTYEVTGNASGTYGDSKI